MNATSPFPLLAYTTYDGVLLHDVLGILALIVLLGFGLFFRKRQHEWLKSAPLSSGTASADTTRAERTLGRLQFWILYWVVVAVTAYFFFGYIRATRHSDNPNPTTAPQGSGNL